MDDTPQPRRSFWRFSLRELLLLVLAIAAFLGWGRAVYQEYKPFSPTSFVRDLDVNRHVATIRESLGEKEFFVPGSKLLRPATSDLYQWEFRCQFPLKRTNAGSFVEELEDTIRQQLRTSGARSLRSDHIEWADSGRQFTLRYRHDIVEGSIRAVLVYADENANLLIFVDEHRARQ